MMNFTLTAAFILCWISVSASESQTVEAQPGEEVTLMCSNISKYDGVMFWFRLVNRNQISCIFVLYNSKSNATLCDGYQSGKFEMRSNTSTVFLQIKQVDLSDSGQYFCGFYNSGRPLFSVIYLNIEDDSEGISKLMSVILGALTVFLVMVIVALVVKSRKRQNGWIIVSFCQPQTVEVLSGQEVTLVSNNMSNYKSVTFWFRLVNRTKTSCISVMIDSADNVLVKKNRVQSNERSMLWAAPAYSAPPVLPPLTPASHHLIYSLISSVFKLGSVFQYSSDRLLSLVELSSACKPSAQLSLASGSVRRGGAVRLRGEAHETHLLLIGN
ncbi:uncharacterized protein [Chaetodon trifascialis]|uniref:uncharacterized protein n=1 Tax=Chaetodon trifascialis TaxID=109706 RepID=UPI00399538A1